MNNNSIGVFLPAAPELGPYRCKRYKHSHHRYTVDSANCGLVTKLKMRFRSKRSMFLHFDVARFSSAAQLWFWKGLQKIPEFL